MISHHQILDMRREPSRRSQPPLALSVPLSRYAPRVGSSSVFVVSQHSR